MRANRRVRVALVVSEVPPRPALFPLFLALRFVLADAADADTAADAISAVDELCLHVWLSRVKYPVQRGVKNSR